MEEPAKGSAKCCGRAPPLEQVLLVQIVAIWVVAVEEGQQPQVASAPGGVGGRRPGVPRAGGDDVGDPQLWSHPADVLGGGRLEVHHVHRVGRILDLQHRPPTRRLGHPEVEVALAVQRSQLAADSPPLRQQPLDVCDIESWHILGEWVESLGRHASIVPPHTTIPPTGHPAGGREPARHRPVGQSGPGPGTSTRRTVRVAATG
uniref:Uncharacterized protein n=1 Tax=uncultured Nocardioidaceae bacterium TaxID=253824 RepID=A0A6J4MAH4_9ACTN|nr:MAG: hypothetical protein AVDCRST_MAG46-2821 [uncultured Nocardioidaceae bacterium]